MKSVVCSCLLVIVLVNWASADEVELFRRLYSPSRIAQVQATPNSIQDQSNSFPTDYVDVDALDDLRPQLIEQEAVPAEPADDRPDETDTPAMSEDEIFFDAPGLVLDAEGTDFNIIDPTAAKATDSKAPTCGCGEAPMEAQPVDSCGDLTPSCCYSAGCGNCGCTCRPSNCRRRCRNGAHGRLLR